MVKGLSKSTESGNESHARALFSTSTSRPSSSHGALKLPTKPKKKSYDDLSMSDDETDYKMLAPQQSPRRSILVTNKENTTFDLSEDDTKPIVPKAKAAAKPKAARPKKDAAEKESKTKKPPAKKAPAAKVEQSPVAKAYAKRLAKKKAVDSDDDMNADELANEMLDSPGGSDSDAPVAKKSAAARPARRSATAKRPAKYSFDDSDDEDGGFNDDDDDDEESAKFSDSD